MTPQDQIADLAVTVRVAPRPIHLTWQHISKRRTICGITLSRETDTDASWLENWDQRAEDIERAWGTFCHDCLRDLGFPQPRATPIARANLAINGPYPCQGDGTYDRGVDGRDYYHTEASE